jgi:hypothetical protein
LGVYYARIYPQQKLDTPKRRKAVPKRIVPLSPAQVKNAKPRKTEYKLFDGEGLFLLVTPSGGKLWRMKYRFEGKERLLSLGAYPEISLAEARTKKGEARKQVANGIDPGAAKKAMRQAKTTQADTFEVIAREWYEKFTPDLKSRDTIMARMERDLFPWIGATPIKEIEGESQQDPAHTVRSIPTRHNRETARRCASDVQRSLRILLLCRNIR